MTHMLRDMVDDLANGVINIPGELFKEQGISLDDAEGEAF